MLIIRDEQMNILSLYMLQNFQEEMIVHLKSVKDFPEEEIDELVENVIREAMDFGITFEEDVRRYLECWVKYGSDFSRLKWASSILKEDSLTGTEKMDRITQYITFILEGK